MTKPTKEQIDAWLLESSCIRQIGVCVSGYGESPPRPVIGFIAHRPQVEAAIELAYAAGRKAGMMEASHVCMTRAHAHTGPDATDHTLAKRTEARNCGFAIRAAMEASHGCNNRAGCGWPTEDDGDQ